MKTTSKDLFGVIAMVLMAIFTGCSSTDVVEPAEDFDETGETITLSFECSDVANATRADNDHVLRYSAIMYEGAAIDGNIVAQRKEALASDEGATTITFEVPEGTYSFVVIGDYIPKVSQDGVMVNPQPNDEGLYADAYYDTHSDKVRIWSLAYKNKNVGSKFFNNDNYDCFADTVKVIKGSDVVNRFKMLPRIVSRISFVSTTEMPADIENITISNFDFFPYYNFIYKNTGTQHGNDSQYRIPNLTIPTSYSAGSKELFYFYSLAPQKQDRDNGLYSMSITVNYIDNSSRTKSVPDKTICPVANFKIKVTGPFLSEPPVQKGPINLILTSDSNWATDDIEIVTN